MSADEGLDLPAPKQGLAKGQAHGQDLRVSSLSPHPGMQGKTCAHPMLQSVLWVSAIPWTNTRLLFRSPVHLQRVHHAYL